jgi:hypothetical protein
MESRDSDSVIGSNNINLAKKCLALISDIAGRGACSQNPEHIGYALQELTQVLVERTGSNDRLFEPVPADQINDLPSWLHEELDFVDSLSQSMAASKHHCGSAWYWMQRLGLNICRCEEAQNTGSDGPWN